MQMPCSRVAVVGLGLIGGSIAKALQPIVELVGVDADPETCVSAARDGITIAQLGDAITSDTLVIVAVPVGEVDAMFGRVAALRTGALITDVCSVKSSVLESAERHGLRFVGGHPMAGSEQSGYGASLDSLFSGARWALTLEAETVLTDWLVVAQVAIALGAGVVPISAAAHDETVAAVSHLPHVLAAALAGVIGGDDATAVRLGLAAGSFRDGTRVARSPAKFWTNVLAQNSSAVTAFIDHVARDLATVSAALDNGDLEVVEAFFARGAAVRTRFDDRTGVVLTLSPGPDEIVVRQLLNLGRHGGYVTSIATADGMATVHARIPHNEASYNEAGHTDLGHT